MSPPTIPSPGTPAGEEVANIIINALREAGYDAGISDRMTAYQWRDFDIVLLWNNLSIGSKRRNRSYLQVTWEKRIIRLSIYGYRWNRDYEGIHLDEFLVIDLADPTSLNKIVSFILATATRDKYKYPFI